VSACATTAIWSSFQKIRDFEEVAAASPAQITSLAARYSLPFGRAMPSEGLSTDQMCLAVQALGASPHLLRAYDYPTARGYLYSIAASGMCCILIIRHWNDKDLHHAVSVVGMKRRKVHKVEKPKEEFDDESSDLLAVLIHDDRHGPNVTATISPTDQNKSLVLQFGDGLRKFIRDKWELVQILLPAHTKIRLTFAELWELTQDIILPSTYAIQKKLISTKRLGIIRFNIRVLQTHSYFEELLLAGHPLGSEAISGITNKVAFSRYIGVVHLSSSSIGEIDVVIDTTSTLKNPMFLIVIPLSASDSGNRVAIELSEGLDCSRPDANWPNSRRR